MLGRYLLTLLLTLVIEGCVAYLIGFRKGKYVLTFAIASLITHPLLNYLLLVLEYLDVTPSLVLITFLEILVVIAEWQVLVYVFGNPKERFLILALLANTTSFLIGIVLFWT